MSNEENTLAISGIIEGTVRLRRGAEAPPLNVFKSNHRKLSEIWNSCQRIPWQAEMELKIIRVQDIVGTCGFWADTKFKTTTITCGEVAKALDEFCNQEGIQLERGIAPEGKKGNLTYYPPTAEIAAFLDKLVNERAMAAATSGTQ